jgi:chromosomal replication initiator protein
VCDYFKVPVNELFTSSRKRNVVIVRQTAMFFAKKYTDLSLAQIGERCGGKDHATVLHACRTIANAMETDKDFRRKLEEIEKIFEHP